MRIIFRLTVCSIFVFLLMGFKAELCKAQVPEGFSIPVSDTTSVPGSPTPELGVPIKQHHHKNNDEPVIDTITISSSTGTNKPDSVVTVKKSKKKKNQDMVPVPWQHTDSVSVAKKDTSSTSASPNKTNDLSAPDEVYKPLTPNDQAASILEAGNRLQGMGSYKDAMSMFDSVINYYPQTFYYKYAFYYKGQADALADRKDEAVKNLTTFIALDSCKSPYCSDSHYMRALVYFHQEDFNSAITDFNFVATHDSTYKNVKFAYLYRAFCYGQQNVYPKAIQDLTKFIFIDNMKTVASADALYNRAFYKIKLTDNRGAIVDYDKAIALYLSIVQSSKTASKDGYTDKLIDTYVQRGLAKAGINKFDEAILDYNLAIKYNPNYAKAYLLRGLAYINQNKQDLGCLDLSQAGELGATEAYDEIKKYCK